MNYLSLKHIHSLDGLLLSDDGGVWPAYLKLVGLWMISEKSESLKSQQSAHKLSKLESVVQKEEMEINDEEGLEQNYLNSYNGTAHILQ